jgi:hypothetical protein
MKQINLAARLALSLAVLGAYGAGDLPSGAVQNSCRGT